MKNDIDFIVLCVVLSMAVASRLTNRSMEQLAVVIVCLCLLSAVRNWLPIPTGAAVRRNPVATTLTAALLLLLSISELGVQNVEGWLSAPARAGVPAGARQLPRNSSLIVDTDSDSDSDIEGPWQQSGLPSYS